MSLIVLLLLVVGIVVVISQKKKRGGTNKPSFVERKRIIWILTGYVGMLAAAFLLYSFIPAASFTKVSDEEVEEAMQKFHRLVYEGKTGVYDEEYLKEQWKFPYEGNRLVISVRENEYIGMTIIVKRKEENDGIVDATYYASPTIVDGIVATDKIQPFQLELAGDSLSIMKPEAVHIKFARDKKEFTVSQFKKDSTDFGRMGSIIGQRMVYLEIPKDLHLEANSDSIYIEEIETN